jgi:hypothetical protein
MTVRILFFQGGGPGAHAADAKLAASLSDHLGNGYRVDIPLMPREDVPDPANWLPAIGDALASNPSVLVGHSLGGYMLLKCLTEERPDVSPRAICIIAAPFPSADENWTFDGFELPRDFGERLPAGATVLVYASEDDEIVPFAHRALYAAAIPASRVRTTAGGHQLGDDLAVVAADILTALEE